MGVNHVFGTYCDFGSGGGDGRSRTPASVTVEEHIWRGDDVRAGRPASAAHVTPSSWRPPRSAPSATRQSRRRLRLFRVLPHGGGVSRRGRRSTEESGRERLHVSHRWSGSEAPQAELSGPGLDSPRPTRAGRCSQHRRLTVRSCSPPHAAGIPLPRCTPGGPGAGNGIWGGRSGAAGGLLPAVARRPQLRGASG